MGGAGVLELKKKSVYSYLFLSGISPKGKERNFRWRWYRALGKLFLSPTEDEHLVTKL